MDITIGVMTAFMLFGFLLVGLCVLHLSIIRGKDGSYYYPDYLSMRVGSILVILMILCKTVSMYLM